MRVSMYGCAAVAVRVLLLPLGAAVSPQKTSPSVARSSTTALASATDTLVLIIQVE